MEKVLELAALCKVFEARGDRPRDVFGRAVCGKLPAAGLDRATGDVQERKG